MQGSNSDIGKFIKKCILHEIKNEKRPVNANFMKVMVKPYVKMPKYIYVPDEKLEEFIQYWIKASNFMNSTQDRAIFINNIINRGGNNSNFKFFIDLDFDKLEFSGKNTSLILKLIKAICREIIEIYGTNAVRNFNIWGRKAETKKYRFHIHFPSIVVNCEIANVILEMIIGRIMIMSTFTELFPDADSIYKAFDGSPYNFGLRLKGSRKISGDGKFIVDKSSEYIPYTKYLDPVEIEDINHHVKLILSSMIHIEDEDIMPTPSSIIRDAIEREVEKKSLKGDTIDMAEADVVEIEKAINDIIYNGEDTVRYRTTTNDYIIFDTIGEHTCPVNPKKTHGKENMYCFYKADGIYLSCFKRKCGPAIRLISRDFMAEFKDSNFDIKTLSNILKNVGIDKAIEYTNRYICQVNHTNATVFFIKSYKRSNPTKLKHISQVSKNSILNMLACTFIVEINDKPKMLNFATIWPNHQDRKIYKGGFRYREFRKEDEEQGILNLFPGFTCSDNELLKHYNIVKDTNKYREDVEVMREHIRSMWCWKEKDDRAFKWVINWLSFCVQKPFIRPDTALCLIGEEGTGKTSFFDNFFRPYFGKNYCHFSDIQTVTKWTEPLSQKVFVVFDEANLSNVSVTNQLKDRITGRTLKSDQKYKETVEFSNVNSFAIITQDSGKIDLTNNSRRFFFLNTVNKYKGFNRNEKAIKIKTDYFARLFDETDWKNIICYFKYDVDIKNFNYTTSIPTFTTYMLKLNAQHVFIKFLHAIASQPVSEREEVKISFNQMKTVLADLYGLRSNISLVEIKEMCGSFPKSISISEEEDDEIDPLTNEFKKFTVFRILDYDELISELATELDTRAEYIKN